MHEHQHQQHQQQQHQQQQQTDMYSGFQASESSHGFLAPAVQHRADARGFDGRFGRFSGGGFDGGARGL